MAGSNQEFLPDAVGLWRSLRDYLSVNITVPDLPDSPEQRSRVAVIVTVTNEAPKGEDFPEIVFEEVHIRISHGSGEHSHRVNGKLASGESATLERSLEYRDLAALDCQVQANVSRRRFFQTTQQATLPASYTKPTMLLFLQAFNRLEIHRPLEAAMALEPPGPDSTLAALQALDDQLERIAQDADEIRESLQSTYRELGVHVRELQDHVSGVSRHLSRVGASCKDLSQAIASHDAARISEAAGVAKGLTSEAVAINRSTEALMLRHEVSDSEAGYRYRGWETRDSRG